MLPKLRPCLRLLSTKQKHQAAWPVGLSASSKQFLKTTGAKIDPVEYLKRIDIIKLNASQRGKDQESILKLQRGGDKYIRATNDVAILRQKLTDNMQELAKSEIIDDPKRKVKQREMWMKLIRKVNEQIAIFESQRTQNEAELLVNTQTSR
eukprot:TRINITY_DN7720_c0_g1_i2.p2 TRINITY_DN7720_c0_g1~~TRINITY_DN7720_c0_g1_i2.p2  ORF type:complete len:151 (-),score=14.71 TRINITY_DN7720_c0_g1_i2:514-966(-)